MLTAGGVAVDEFSAAGVNGLLMGAPSFPLLHGGGGAVVGGREDAASGGEGVVFAMVAALVPNADGCEDREADDENNHHDDPSPVTCEPTA